MVKAELQYNPYNLSTSIRFNGQTPRINSLVEKYQSGSLRDWVSMIPKVFYDEMNGYDFDLDFSGTVLDYEELKSAFLCAGVNVEDVRIFLRNELDSRKNTAEKIQKTIEWLDANRDSYFDYDAFRMQNRDLIDGSFPFMIIGGRIQTTETLESEDISIEYIEDIAELESTVLKCTPVMVCISNDNISKLQSIISSLLRRNDVTKNQLFFIINKQLDAVKVERTIIDLGIENPQIVDSVDDAKIMKYFELFPLSDYLHEMVLLLNNEIVSLTDILEKENQKSALANKEIHEKLDNLEDGISRLKESLNFFLNRDNVNTSIVLSIHAENLMKTILSWKNRKTKTTKIDEASELSQEFETTIQQTYAAFVEAINDTCSSIRGDINQNYYEEYANAEFDVDFSIDDVVFKEPQIPFLNPIREKFMEMKEEDYVPVKEDIIGRFFKAPTGEKELVLETTFLLQNWREYAIKIIDPLINQILKDFDKSIQMYESAIAKKYIDHLNELIEEEMKKKESVASQLSSEEKQLQDDNDWLHQFADQLTDIERG